MEICRHGVTRVVILTRRYAIKLPNGESWKSLLYGLLANMQERRFAVMDWPELCPVRFSLPGGWLVVMPRARVMTDDEFATFDFAAFVYKGEYVVPAERKSDSFGYLDGRVVAIDYGGLGD